MRYREEISIVIKYTGIILIALYCVIVPCVMFYFGVNSIHCEDLFPIWLIVGGVLWYVDIAIFLGFMFSRNFECTICKASGQPAFEKKMKFVFYGFSFVVLIWWVFGFGRIFGSAKAIVRNPSGSKGIFDQPWFADPFCKQALFDFPFWLTLSPFMMLGVAAFFGIMYCFVSPQC